MQFLILKIASNLFHFYRNIKHLNTLKPLKFPLINWNQFKDMAR